MEKVTAMIGYIQSHIVSLLFTVIFFSSVIYVIRLHLSNGIYKNFRLAQMIMRGDGTLDRKAIERLMLLFMTLYGFLHVMHKQPDMLIAYFWAMMAAWGIFHVAGDKLPNLGIPKIGPPPNSSSGDSK